MAGRPSFSPKPHTFLALALVICVVMMIPWYDSEAEVRRRTKIRIGGDCRSDRDVGGKMLLRLFKLSERDSVRKFAAAVVSQLGVEIDAGCERVSEFNSANDKSLEFIDHLIAP
jgi:hypothetical protein